VHEPRSAESLQELLLHRFEDLALLERALIHRSFAHDQTPPGPDNERLEFLGDAVIGLVVAENLFHSFEDDSGRLTRARARVVRREALAEYARGLELGCWLRLGRGEQISEGQDKASILADAFEVLVGALYLDGGMPVARRFLLRMLGDRLGQRDLDGGIHSPRDARNRLQDLLQRQGRGTPRYKVVGSEGPPHQPCWTVEVGLPGVALGRSTGGSKQEAGMKAAAVALEELGEPPPGEPLPSPDEPGA
jgi:ribonuclease III